MSGKVNDVRVATYNARWFASKLNAFESHSNDVHCFGLEFRGGRHIHCNKSQGCYDRGQIRLIQLISSINVKIRRRSFMVEVRAYLANIPIIQTSLHNWLSFLSLPVGMWRAYASSWLSSPTGRRARKSSRAPRPTRRRRTVE